MFVHDQIDPPAADGTVAVVRVCVLCLWVGGGRCRVTCLPPVLPCSATSLTAAQIKRCRNSVPCLHAALYATCTCTCVKPGCHAGARCYRTVSSQQTHHIPTGSNSPSLAVTLAYAPRPCATSKPITYTFRAVVSAVGPPSACRHPTSLNTCPAVRGRLCATCPAVRDRLRAPI